MSRFVFKGRQVEAEVAGGEMNPAEAERLVLLAQTGPLSTTGRGSKASVPDGRMDSKVTKTIADYVLGRLDGTFINTIAKDQILPEVEKLVATSADLNKFQLNLQEQRQIAASIVDDILGQGPLDELLSDASVTEIMVNGPHNIWVEKNGKTIQSNIKFRDEEHLLGIAKRMARYVGRPLDELNPYVDARLPDGSRVNIVSHPVSLDGTSISIRKFPVGKLSLKHLQSFGAMSPHMATFIECIAAARCNIIVSGGTSSGKTTILNTLGDFIRPTERVITIEDSAELKIGVGNKVRMETRSATAEANSKEITQRDLLKNSLRMRPDRIILGEVRGGEAFDLLQAMGTGHDGSMGTLHSNNPRDTCRRLENMVLMGGIELPIRVIRSQIVSAVEFIIHAVRGADGKRRISHITEITGLEDETIAMQDVFFYEAAEDKAFAGGRHVANAVSLRCAGKLREYGQYERAMEAVLSSPKMKS